MKKITISYTDEQCEWLNKHPEINKSGLFRTVISYLMKMQRVVLSNDDLDKLFEQKKGK